ncbi:AraC family transcriptional regulator [Glutamicibacter sp. AOP38-B1-38]|uniref:AraC family transcriptional regulator n=1 Tax=Glutamicibacter sp. AOP38-B1-38 TaxID=3457680 RepID=UPI0040346BA1
MPGEQTWISYEERFEVVLSHIYEHLGEPLDLIQLAEVAGFSPRHWHRIFSEAFGESLPSLVKRVRLQRAVILLAENRPIREIAAVCGYPNVSSFTRAFRIGLGMTPAQYREQGGHVDLRAARMRDDPKRFEVLNTDIPAIPCLAVRHRGSFLQIDRAYHDLRLWLLANGFDPAAEEMYGIYLSDPSQTPEAELESLACVTVPKGFQSEPRPLSRESAAPTRYTIRGGPYAVFTHVGAYADMPESYAWLFGCWLPHSGRKMAEEPVVEHYITRPDEGTPVGMATELMLPLKTSG